MGLQTIVALDGVPQQKLSIRAGDRLPALVVRLEDLLGDPVPLAGLTVFFTPRPLSPGHSGVVLGSGEMRIENTLNSTVSYDWQPGDTDCEPGSYDIRIDLYNSSGVLQQSVPTLNGQGVVEVQPGVNEFA